MHAERTPNPNSVKWVLSRDLAPGQAGQFAEPVDASVSPLAARLFTVPGVVGVFVTGNFVTVTKDADLEWADLAEKVVDVLKAFAESGEPALGPGFAEFGSASGGAREDGGVVARIQDVLEREVRPAVEMDGGDVVFVGFEDGRVSVSLVGACAGCPSSSITLRLAVEARLKEAVPEVREVVSV